MRFTRLVESQLMTEHGRQNIAVTPAARKAGMGVSVSGDDMYMATAARDGDLPDHEYMKIIEDKNSYPHLFPSEFHSNGLRWDAYMLAGSFNVLSQHWFSIAVLPSWLVRHKAKAIVGIVVAPSVHYVVILQVKVMEQKAKLFTVSVDASDLNSVYQVVLIDLADEGWQVIFTSGVSPLACFESLESPARK
jgi:hypothetical protein